MHGEATAGTLLVQGSDGATLQLADGRRCIDLASAGLGLRTGAWRTPAFERQLADLPLSMRLFVSRPLAELAERLAVLAPGDLAVSYPANSRSEAVEGALKLARGIHPRRPEVVSVQGAYHGATLGALSVCGIDELRGAVPSLPLAGRAVPRGVDPASVVTRRTAAVLLDLFPTAVGGIPDAAWLPALRRRCHRTGTLLVVDEVSTGFGRTGVPFAVDRYGVVPDVLVVGGALGGGLLPMAAYITTRRLHRRLYGRRDPTFHASATAGNPAACRAALDALACAGAPATVAHVARLGRLLRDELQDLCRRHPHLELRAASAGIVGALSSGRPGLVRAAHRRAPACGTHVQLRRQGDDECLGIDPPLLIDDAELRAGLAALETALLRAAADTGPGTRRRAPTGPDRAVPHGGDRALPTVPPAVDGACWSPTTAMSTRRWPGSCEPPDAPSSSGPRGPSSSARTAGDSSTSAPATASSASATDASRSGPP